MRKKTQKFTGMNKIKREQQIELRRLSQTDSEGKVTKNHHVYRGKNNYEIFYKGKAKNDVVE